MKSKIYRYAGDIVGCLLLNESEFKPDPELRDKVCPNAEIHIIVTWEIKPL